MKNKCNAEIGGIRLTLYTEYEQVYVDALAEKVSGEIGELVRGTGNISTLNAALLLLLDKTDAAARVEAENARLKKELETMKLDLEIATIENEKLKEKNK